MIDERYRHLALTDWPFTVVPRRDLCTFMADRAVLREDLQALLRTLIRHNSSSLQLMWSSLGAGKTHSLYYFGNEAARVSTDGTTAVTSVYTEFPKGPKGFLDLYRSFIAALDVDQITMSFLEFTTGPSADSFVDRLTLTQPDLATALRVIVIGQSLERATALRWLRGDDLPISDFRKIGISRKLASTEDASRVLSTILQLVGDARTARRGSNHRFVWIIDEFQRISRLRSGASEDINAGLHSVFNSLPTGLTLFLSFSNPPESKLPDWFSPELRDRIGATKVLILPPLQESEALLFIRDILGHFRTPDTAVAGEYFPFSKKTCEAVIRHVMKQSELRPRKLEQAFNAVLDAADEQIRAGKMQVVSPEFAVAILAEYVIVDEAEE